jgi:large subunit ribosomal protein L35
MPKMKTHKATAKRIKVTGSGKLMRKRACGRHLLRKKSSRRKRRFSVPGLIAPVDRKRIRQLISPGL